MSKTQKTSGTVTASSCKDGYQPCQASPVLLLGTRLHLDSGRGLIGKELSPDIEFLPSLADKQTPLHPPTGLVYCDILVLEWFRNSPGRPAFLHIVPYLLADSQRREYG